ncbi:MAG: hypothetical protein PHS82_09040, partial [Lachnospiraceae bacterium]|nr:hypothetical protein [Lachnospiraceae bacterium]
MQNELTFFLESFRHTGIYLIDRTTMEVYYENAIAQKYTVEDRIGRPCYQVHGNKTMCSSCPLRKPERVSHVIREDLGMTFVMHAIETRWQGKDVYTILVQKQEELSQKSMDEAMKKRMDRALCASVLSYCEINMRTLRSQSRFFSDPDVEHVIEDIYTEHLRKMCEYYIHPEDRDHVGESIGLERLQDLSADGDGPKEFRVRYRSSGAKGTKAIVMESTVHILRDELPHYVSIITKEVTKEESIQRKLELFAEAAKDAVSLFQLNITQDKCVVSSGTNTVLGDVGLELEHCQTLEPFRNCVISHIPDGEYRAVARDFFDRKQMLEHFANDEKTLKKRFLINIGQDQYIWVMMELNMVQNPLTGDVEGILYSEQIDERVLKDNIITQVINNDYDYIII